MDIFDTAAKLIRIEKEKGIGFTPEGWPRFESWMFQKEIPESILPYSHRREALLKEKTSICFYEHDKYLYPFVNMSKLEALASELHKYNSFIGFDLSVFYDMLYPLQKFYILMNLLVDIYLALSGNRLIPNCRADQTAVSLIMQFSKMLLLYASEHWGVSKIRLQEENQSVPFLQ